MTGFLRRCCKSGQAHSSPSAGRLQRSSALKVSLNCINEHFVVFSPSCVMTGACISVPVDHRLPRLTLGIFQSSAPLSSYPISEPSLSSPSVSYPAAAPDSALLCTNGTITRLAITHTHSTAMLELVLTLSIVVLAAVLQARQHTAQQVGKEE